jgi:N6-L-threonylcarbamoyladenine synthase
LATREHLRNFAPLLERAKVEVGFDKITQIAVTNGPGLAACLAIGVAAAKSLALALRVPLVGVNHLRGHAWSPFIALHAEAPKNFDVRLSELLPHLGLIVSGGNTLLFRIDEVAPASSRHSAEEPAGMPALLRPTRITVISSTRDDAAGEALDKGAKLLGLGYPGGPLIEQLAAGGRKDAFDFPRGIGPRGDLDFSFSGLKTSLRYLIEKLPPDEVRAKTPDLCASYQQAVVDALVRKTHFALEREDFKSLGLSGGVANNRTLRAALEAEAKRARIPFFAAQPQHTGDNAGMIAFAAWAEISNTTRADGMILNVEPSSALA